MEKLHIHKCHFPFCLGRISQVNDNHRCWTSSEIAIREWILGSRGQVMGNQFFHNVLTAQNSVTGTPSTNEIMGCRILQANSKQKLTRICSHLWGQKTLNNGMWEAKFRGERQSLLCSAQNSISKMSLAPRHKKKKQKKSMNESELWNVL